MAFVSTPEQVADRLIEYIDIGISSFILSGYPNLEEASNSGKALILAVKKKLLDQSPEDLVYSKFDSPKIIQAVKDIEQAEAVIVASPIYKASYTGVLKSFLNLLPQKGLQGKIVLPLAIGGTIAHLLAIDHALKPVLSSLNTYHILSGVYVLDTQVVREDDKFTLHPEIELRLQEAANTFAQEVIWRCERVCCSSSGRRCPC